MSTRSLTAVHADTEDAEEFITIYKHYDCYPDGYGAALAAFLRDFTIVNGFSGNEVEPIANGDGCLAAQIVAHFKKGAGDVSLYPVGTRDVWEDYIYHVYPKVGEPVRMTCETSHGKVLFDGLAADFDCDKIQED